MKHSAAIVAGAAIGVVGNVVGPGIVDAIGAGAMSILTRVSGGYSSGGLVGMLGDAANAVPAPVYAAPVGAVTSAAYGAVASATGLEDAGEVLISLSVEGAAAVAANAGGIAAIGAVGITEFLNRLLVPQGRGE